MLIRNTELIEIKDSVFTIGTKEADCIAIWLKSGLSGLFTEWKLDFLPIINKHKILSLANNEIIPKLSENIFTHPTHRFFEIIPQINTLKYLYFFPNENNTWINEDMVSITSDLIIDALLTISTKPIKTMVMNGILGTEGHGHNQNIDNQISAIMIQTIQEWLSNNQTPLQKIILVNKTGQGFGLE